MSADEFVGESEADELRVAVENKAVQAAEELRDAFSQLFSTPNGKHVLAYLAREHRLHARVELPDGPIDPYRLAFDAGRRSVVTDIVQRIAENDPNLEIPPN